VSTRALLASVAIAALVAGCKADSKRSPSPPDATSSSRALAPDPFAAVRWDDTPIDWTRAVPATPPGGLAEAGYVGSEACKPCHEALYGSFARHSMARSGLRPLASLDQKWLATIFDAAASQSIVSAHGDLSYRPYREGGKYFVEERMLAPDGKEVQSWVEPLTFALSAGSYGMAFYFRKGSRIYQAPIDYYAMRARWDMDPGAAEGNPRFSKSLDSFCISCHSDYPRRRVDVDDVFFDPMPRGIGCERCHGPGEKHVKSLLPGDIVNPAHLSSTRQLDVCAQCHQSSLATLRADRDEFSYRPGTPLDSFRVNYLGEPPEPDRFELLAHPERMVRSACFRGSGGKLTCTSCHDPHRSSFEQPAAWWDAKCDACHHDHPCTEQPAVRAAQNDHCINCHMRRGSPPNLPLVTVTDHWIQRRPPPSRPEHAHPQRLVAWSTVIGDPVSGDDLLAVRAVAEGRADPSFAHDAARLTASALDRRPHVPRLYRGLASHFERLGEPQNAARAYAALLRFDPDERAALFGYATAMQAAGSPGGDAEAMRAIDRLLALDPDDPGALEMKATSLFRNGKIDEAAPLFARAAAAGTTTAPSHVALAALALRAGRSKEAVAELEAARCIEPGDPWILSKLSDAYAAANDVARAAELARAQTYFHTQSRGPTSATRWLPAEWR
jgi:Flp pilus assembly protein TadD